MLAGNCDKLNRMASSAPLRLGILKQQQNTRSMFTVMPANKYTAPDHLLWARIGCETEVQARTRQVRLSHYLGPWNLKSNRRASVRCSWRIYAKHNEREHSACASSARMSAAVCTRAHTHARMSTESAENERQVAHITRTCANAHHHTWMR